MNKKIFLSILAIVALVLVLLTSNSETEVEKLKKKHAKFLQEHPYNKTMHLSKKERKSLGLPPNAYFEQEYLNEMNPNTGRTHPENVFKLQYELNLNKNLRRAPGDKINNSWIERGPNNIGGRTRVVLFDPNDENHKRVFAGGVSGGLWVNNDITDATTSWQQVGISENVAVTCITVDPNNSQIMYIGTGESQSDSGPGNGIWKSIDGGTTWTNIYRNDSDSDLGERFYYINDILAWNNNGSTELFLGVAGGFAGFNQFPGDNVTGLYKSTDEGITWNRINLKPIPETSQGSPNSYYEPKDIKVGIDNAIWVSTDSNIYGKGGGTILKSTDGNRFILKYNLSEGKRTEIALSKQDKNKIYVLASGSTTPILMLKTDDDFATTTNMSLPTDADNDIPANDFTRGQAFYDLVLEVDPQDDQILYAGGIDLFRSEDSGDTWVQISKWSNNNTLALQNISLVHADQHGFTFHPTDSDKAVIGNDGGVYYASSLSQITLNGDESPISTREKNYNTTQFYHGSISQETSSDVFLAGAQDNGTPYINSTNSTGTSSGIDVYGGDGAYSFIDKDGEYMIASYVYNVKARYNLPYNGSGIQLDNDQDTGSFINPQTLDDNLDILFSNGSTSSYDSIVRYKGIKPSANLAKDKIGNVFLLNESCTTLEVSPFSLESTTLFLGLRNGKLLKVENADNDIDDNINWTNISQNLSTSGSISDISFGDNEDEIFVTFHNYGIKNIWYTNDGGTIWQDKEGDFPDIPVKAILQNPLNDNEVIIGTDLGVWRTDNFFDSFPNWVQSSNGMSNVRVTSFDLRESDNTVLATTYGRGMFTGKFKAGTASIEEVVSNTKTFTVYPSISNGNFTVFAKSTLGNAELDVFDISGRQVYTTKINFSENEKQLIFLNVNNGIYIVNLTDEQGKRSSKKIVIQ